MVEDLILEYRFFMCHAAILVLPAFEFFNHQLETIAFLSDI